RTPGPRRALDFAGRRSAMTQPTARVVLLASHLLAGVRAPRFVAWLLAVTVLGCAPVTSGEVRTTPAAEQAERPVRRPDDPTSAREALARVNAEWSSRWFHT